MSERLDEILSTLRTLVSFDVRTLFDNNSALLPVALWPAGASLAVASITSRELFNGYGDNRVLIGVKHNVKLTDRTKALQLAMAEAGLLTDRPPPPGREPITAVTYEVIDQLTDADLARIIANPALRAAGSTVSWEDASPAAIDTDYARITQAYDALRPGVRLNTPSQNPAQGRQRLLPPPHDATPPAERTSEASAEALEPVLPDPPPEPYRQPVQDRRRFVGAVDEWALFGGRR